MLIALMVVRVRYIFPKNSNIGFRITSKQFDSIDITLFCELHMGRIRAISIVNKQL